MSLQPTTGFDWQKIVDWLKANWWIIIIILVVLFLLMRRGRGRRIIIE